jgi:soluble lytic murein transglycosylase
MMNLRISLRRGEHSEVEKQARSLLGLRGIAQQTRDEAEFYLGTVLLRGASAAHREGKALLRKLLNRDTEVDWRIGALTVIARDGDLKAARRLLMQYPDSPGGREWSDRLDALGLSESERMARIRVLFSMRVHDLLLPELHRMISRSGARPLLRQEARLKLATIQMRLREKYDAALALLKEAEKGPSAKLAGEARYRQGLVQGSRGDFERGSAIMKSYLAGGAPGGYAESANYQIGRLLHQGGQYQRALVEHERFLESKPWDRSKWLWFKGWMHFRAGDCPSARRVFDALHAKSNTLVGAKALYWSARCLKIEGDEAGAKRMLAKLAQRAAQSYYGILGAALSGTYPARSERPMNPISKNKLHHFEARLPPRLRRLARKVRLLAAAGYVVLARSAATTGRLRRKARKHLSRKERLRFAAALDRVLENWGPVWKKMTRKRKRLAWNDSLDLQSRGVRRQVYPPAYLGLARAAGEDLGISPWWLLAHMLQESRYKERAKSHAWALGPMQILPRTGRRLADLIGFPPPPFRDSKLHEPGVALRQAASYLSMLRDEFGGNTMLAMASYNGGPLRMSEHLVHMKGQPFDVAIEEIGAHEMRNYIRKIVDHTLRYVELYGTDDERQSIVRALWPRESLPRSKGVVRF